MIHLSVTVLIGLVRSILHPICPCASFFSCLVSWRWAEAPFSPLGFHILSSTPLRGTIGTSFFKCRGGPPPRVGAENKMLAITIYQTCRIFSSFFHQSPGKIVMCTLLYAFTKNDVLQKHTRLSNKSPFVLNFQKNN